jgi:hypothetical protein
MGILIYLYKMKKTFLVVVAIVNKLVGAIGEMGLLMLPCITYHLI